MGKVVSDIGNVVSGVGKMISDMGNAAADIGIFVSGMGNVVSDIGKMVSDIGKTFSDMGNFVSGVGKTVSESGNTTRQTENPMKLKDLSQNQPPTGFSHFPLKTYSHGQPLSNPLPQNGTRECRMSRCSEPKVKS
jgi:hypothetical protein